MIAARLSALMFVQFFIWGAWLVTTADYLGKRVATGEPGWEIIGTAYSLCPIAAMISPIFLGMVADRFFATQKVLGVMHVLSGVAMCGVAVVAGSADASPATYTGLLLAHALCYMPTVGLANTISFANMTDQARQFPMIRVFGTLGWIAAGYVVSGGFEVDATETGVADAAMQYWVAGIASVLLGGFSFTLPHTPPPSAGRKVGLFESLGLGALPLLRQPAFAVFIVVSFLTCIPLMAYYARAQPFVGDCGFERPAVTMAYGQWAEVVFMLLMPAMFARLGVKWMLGVGILAWVVRYGLFSLGAGDSAETSVAWMVLAGILLHGVCYDFFFVTGYIYAEQVAPPAIRGQAQGFVVLMTLGLGSYFGSHAVEALAQAHKAPEAVVLESQAETVLAKVEELRRTDRAALMPPERERVDAADAEAKRLRQDANAIRLRWGDMWRWPALGALAVLLAFLGLFRPGREGAA